MALTQEYKNEVERILKAWKDVVASQWGKTWNEVRDYLLKNYKKVLDDPFLASFKTTRTLEETAWLFKRLQQFYGDEKDGIFTQIKSTMNMDIPHGYLYNTHLLKNQVIANLNERTDTLIKEQEAGTTATTNLSKWTGAFPNLTAEQVLTKYNEPKEIHTDYDKIKGDLKAWTDTFPLPLTPDAVKTKYEEPKETHTSEQITKWETAQSDLTNLTIYWNDNISKDYELPKFSMEGLIEAHKDLKDVFAMLKNAQEVKEWWQQNKYEKYGEKITKETLTNIKNEIDKLTNNQEKHTDDQLEKHTADQLKPDDYDKNINELNDWRANFPNKKPSEAKQEANQQAGTATQGTQYLNKLIEVYKAQIKQETQAFYLNKLGLDESDDIRPKYNGVEYLTLLDKLNGDSEPEQVINAFKIVALIVITEQAQAESDEWVDPATNTIQAKYNATRYKKLKQNKIDYFNKVKGFWDANAELTTTENNNPLYLPIITQKQDYITKINNILKIWQA